MEKTLEEMRALIEDYIKNNLNPEDNLIISKIKYILYSSGNIACLKHKISKTIWWCEWYRALDEIPWLRKTEESVLKEELINKEVFNLCFT